MLASHFPRQPALLEIGSCFKDAVLSWTGEEFGMVCDLYDLFVRKGYMAGCWDGVARVGVGEVVLGAMTTIGAGIGCWWCVLG